MPLKKDDSGRRYVEVEVEVPGSPETVWEAIVTGPGVSSWFVPTTSEHGPDGKPVKIISNFGPGMDSISTVTGWDPPHVLKAESKDLGEEAPSIATEWIVEARDGNTCLVRVVHSLFTDKSDWDKQMEGWESGWPAFFRLLKLYLKHFPGMPARSFQLNGQVSDARPEAWGRLMEALGFGTPEAGQALQVVDSAPPLKGVAELVGPPEYPEELLLRLDTPAPGLGHLFALPMGDITYLSVRYYLYGDTAAEVCERDAPRWQAWMAERFPPPK